MISGSSVLCAVAVYTIALILICPLRQWTGFLKIGGTTILMLAFGLATLRLLAPLELPFTYTIRSWNILGKSLDFFRTYAIIVRVLAVIWAVGAGVVLILYAIEMHRSYDLYSRYLLAEDEKNAFVQDAAKRLGITCPVKVTRDVKGPCVVGIFHHTIYFPSEEFPEEWVEFALMHEQQHIRSHHSQIKLFFGIISAFMWWNPIAHWGRRNVDALLELHCDRAVTANMSEEDRTEYAKMLNAFAQIAVSSKQRVPALALNESLMASKDDRFLKQRLTVITGHKDKLAWAANIAALFILTAMFFLSYSVMFQPAVLPFDNHVQNDWANSYDESYDGPESEYDATDAFIVKEPDGRYQLFINYTFNRYLTEDELASDQYKNLLIVEEKRQQ